MNYLELFSSHVTSLRDVGGEASGKCCFHNDKRSSFSVNLETGLWICHAGCGSGNSLTFSRRVGQASPGLAPPRSQPKNSCMPSSRSKRSLTSSCRSGRAGPLKKIEATYDYEYEDGSHAYQVVRFSPKSFAQRVKVDGRWSWKVGDRRRVPYRLPKILKTKELIILVEGEKDVEKLESLGLVGTTTPMGANNWKQDYAAYFRGKYVAIVPDSDPQGMAYAKRAAGDITQNGGHAKLVTLPGIPEKGDVSDFLGNLGMGREDLLVYIRQAKPWSLFRPDALKPFEYFAERNMQIAKGDSLLTGEIEAYARETIGIVFGECCSCTEAVKIIIDQELDPAIARTKTSRTFDQMVGVLKKVHQMSLV